MMIINGKILLPMLQNLMKVIINLLFGTSIQEFKGLYTEGWKINKQSKLIEEAIFAYVPPENIRDRFNDSQIEAGITSLSPGWNQFSRLQYSYKDKYLISCFEKDDLQNSEK